MPLRPLAAAVAVLTLAASLLAAAASPAVASGPRRLELTYEIYYGGFLSGSLDVTVDATEGRYQMASRLRSRGAIDMLIRFTASSESQGVLSAGRVAPRRYRTDNTWMGEARRVRSTYRPDGGVEAVAVPSAAEDDREEIPPAAARGSVDPLSAAFALARSAGAGAACTTEVRVFDGWRLYDLRLAYGGEERLTGDRYTGPARRCRVTFTRLGGRSQRPWLPRSVRPSTAELWFAPVAEGLPPVPVRLETEVAFATLVAHLVAARATGPTRSEAAAAIH